MSKKTLLIGIVALLLVVAGIWAIFSHSFRSTKSQYAGDSGNVSSVSNVPVHSPDNYGESSFDFPRDAESDEPPPLEPAAWTLNRGEALSAPARIWSDNEKPTLAELPDSLTWYCLSPTNKRPFTAHEKEALVSRGFFLEEMPSPRSLTYDDMIDAYTGMRVLEYGDDYTTVPFFITSDFLLHVYHVVFDRALQQAEERQLFFDVRQLTVKMYNVSEKLYRSAPEGTVRDALLGNVAYFGVAGSLLDSAFAVAPEAKELVNAELALITQASGVTISPSSQQQEDYTQFKPRGHYTKTKRLSRFFRAMMWYGRQPFPVNSEERTLMAIQQVRLFADPEITGLWRRITDAIGYLVDNADDITCKEYLYLTEKIYGSNQPDFADKQKLAQFMAEAQKLPAPAIADHPLPNRHDPASNVRNYRFMGQRLVPDAMIFTRLTSPRVGSDAQPRNIPTGLDVMSVLGSQTADGMLGKYRAIPGYTDALNNLKGEFANYPENRWVKTVYWRWLYTLRALLPEKGNTYPFFARGQAWAAKSLLTSLGSWSELKHDAILFSKQSGAECGEGGEGPPPPPQPKSYVEPDITFFNRFLDLIYATAKTFSDNQLLSDEYLRKFSLLYDRTRALRDIAQKELNNAPISHDEYKLMLDFADDISSIVLPEGSGDIIDEKFKQMALVADVHTDFFGSRVLEEGVGAPQRIYVAVKDNAGGTRVCVGYVYTYYEFMQPLARRMNDDEWKAMIYPEIKKEVRTWEPEWIRQMRVK